MHISQSIYLVGRSDEEEDHDGEGDVGRGDDDYEPDVRPGLLHCPFRACDRNEPFTTRGNLVRHFQTRMFPILPSRRLLSYLTDVFCYEMCPFY